ncbi:MAG TPA: hypothetical protein VNO30_45335 [Kofleriaceae bacterium]|nr:hypothetical protein [Kofleriaceae bacterium]
MTVKREIAPVLRQSRLGEIDEEAERRAYWAVQPMEARIAEVEVLRRMWIELTGDPDQPMQLVVHKRRLGDPAPTPPSDSAGTPRRRSRSA